MTLLTVLLLLAVLEVGCLGTHQEVEDIGPPIEGYSGPLYKTFIFHETRPWSHLPCPKGYFVSSLTYHFSGPFPEGHRPQNGTHQSAKKNNRRATTESPAMIAAKRDTTLTLLDALHIHSKENLDKLSKTRSKGDFIFGPPNQLPIDVRLVRQELSVQSQTFTSLTKTSVISEILPKGFHLPKRFGGCPTLVYCIGHQSCAFHFSNELCKNDPVPGVRKHLHVRLMCEATDQFVVHLKHYTSIAMEAPNYVETPKWPEHVMFLNYKSQIEARKRDYQNIEVTRHRIPTSMVFHQTCPSLLESRKLGYRGECLHGPPDVRQIRTDLWKVLSRIPEEVCQQEVVQVYCAYKYNPTGRCFPPFVLKQGKFQPPYFNFQSFPENGNRPDLVNYEKIFQNPHMGLIPARIGFLILAHQSPRAILQLIELLYRPEHYYVIHMDRRKEEYRQELVKLLLIQYPSASNIHVLPLHRSFVASWGSYYITRAELEGMEELLRMGVWDFFVILSGSDLPLRNIDDFALTVAPYRGLNFLRLVPIREASPMGPETAWHSCGGHVYNVTERDPIHEDLTITGHSTWIILSRDAVEFLVVEEKGPALDMWHFYLQTFFITDETYIATILANSPLSINHQQGFFHFMRPFEKHDINGLCRHSLETDACGLGPLNFEAQELFVLSLQTHRNFFARKFSTEPSDNARMKVIESIKEDVYGEWLHWHYTTKILWELGQMVLESLEQQYGPLVLLNVTRWQAVPVMHPTDPCCKQPMTSGVTMVNEFLVILTLEVRDSSGGKQFAKASVIPRRLHTCFPSGSIRFMHLTTRYDEKSESLSHSSTHHPFIPQAHPHAQPIPDVIKFAPLFERPPFLHPDSDKLAERPPIPDHSNNETTQEQTNSAKSRPLPNSPDYTRGDKNIADLDMGNGIFKMKMLHAENRMNPHQNITDHNVGHNVYAHPHKQGAFDLDKPLGNGADGLPPEGDDFVFEKEDRRLDQRTPNNNEARAGVRDDLDGDLKEDADAGFFKERQPQFPPQHTVKMPMPGPLPNRAANSENPSFAPPTPPRPFLFNLPVPYVPAGGDTLWLHMELYLSKPDKECSDRAKEQNMQRLHYMQFTGDNYPQGPPEIIVLDAVLVDPQGAARCKREMFLELSGKTIKPNEVENKTMFNLPIKCGELGPGLWTLQLKQRNLDNPYVYSHSIYLLPTMPELYEDMALQHLHTLWSVGEAVLWNSSFDEYYNSSSMIAKNANSKSKPWFLQNQEPDTMQNISQSAKVVFQKQSREVIDVVYYVLFGVTMLGSLFIYNLCLTRRKTVRSAVRRTVFHRRHLVMAFGVVSMQVLFYQLGRRPSLVPHDVDTSTHHSHHASSGF